MFLKKICELLMKYFDARKEVENNPVLSRDLDIHYNQFHDIMVNYVVKSKEEERKEALDYIEEELRIHGAKEIEYSQAVDDYREREDIRVKFEKLLLEERAKISELEGFKTIISSYVKVKEV